MKLENLNFDQFKSESSKCEHLIKRLNFLKSEIIRIESEIETKTNTNSVIDLLQLSADIRDEICNLFLELLYLSNKKEI